VIATALFRSVNAIASWENQRRERAVRAHSARLFGPGTARQAGARKCRTIWHTYWGPTTPRVNLERAERLRNSREFGPW